MKPAKLLLKPFTGTSPLGSFGTHNYEPAIHKNPTLSEIASEIDKVNYLKSLLDCTAHESIAGLILTSAKYNEAVYISKSDLAINYQPPYGHSA